jgi:4-amino-4-deoxy-L-arabinose transferase-like glycosyltransferase
MQFNKLYNLIVFFLILISLFSGLNILELNGEEPRRATVAMEMALSDQYISPKIHGWNYYNKPP